MNKDACIHEGNPVSSSSNLFSGSLMSLKAGVLRLSQISLIFKCYLSHQENK